MRGLTLLALSSLLATQAMAQSVNEKAGESFVQISIVGSKEYFKLPDGTHKELLGGFLQGIAYQDNKKFSTNGGEIEKLQVAPFEIHIQGDNLGKLSLADIRATAVRFLYASNTSGGIGFTADLRGLKLDYRNYALNEPSGKNLKYGEISIADVRPGVRLSGKNSYIVIGGVAAFGPYWGFGKNDLERLNLTVKDFETQEVFDKEDDLSLDGTGVIGSIGAYSEINLGDKFKLSGSALWGSRNTVEGQKYNVREQVMVPVPVEELAVKGSSGDSFPGQGLGDWQEVPSNSLEPAVKMEERTKKYNRNFSVYSQRFNLQVNFESDLGKLISPALTGVSVTGGLNMYRMKVGVNRAQVSYQIDGETSPTNDGIQFEHDRDDVLRYDQLQLNVGIRLNLNEIKDRNKARSKYKGMADMY